MFGKLKEKLKGWLKKSTQDIEESAPKEEIKEEVKEKPAKKTKSKEDTSKKQSSIADKEKKKGPEKKEIKKATSKEKGSKKQLERIDKEEISKRKPEIKEEAKKSQEKEEKLVEKKEEEEKVEEKIKNEKEEIKTETKKEGFFKRLFGKKEEEEKQTEETKEEISKEDTSKESSKTIDKEEVPEKTEEEKIKPPKNIIDEEKETPEIKQIEEKVENIKKEVEEAKKQEKEEREGFFKKLRSTFTYKITPEEFNRIFDDLEMLFLENNVALEVVEDIRKNLSQNLIGKEIKKEDLEQTIREYLKKSLNEILIEPDDPLDAVKLNKKSKKKPFVILFFGINGTGKTTSIAKIAYLLKKNDISVVLAAADTFRAASIEQIQEHADKLNVPLIKQDYGADPSAVGFDAIKYAEKHNIDAVLIDTAGRMHTKTNLLAEMEKICRVTNPDLKIFVAESIAGNDAVDQAKSFHEMINIDGSILSKADIDEKGGTIISVSHATRKPIFYLGTGQNYEDLKLFDKQKYIEDLGLD
jgi:fused signal recognition particle receptor